MKKRVTSNKLWSNKLSCLLLVTFTVLVTLLRPTPVFAHILQTDKDIGAVLHINPDDDPIVGQAAGFFFEFKDKSGRFDPKRCDCQFYIFEDGAQIFAQPLFQGDNPSLSSAILNYTFPQKDIYEIRVVGRPLSQNDFQPFTLKYNLRVSRVAEVATSTKPDSTPFNWLSIHFIHLVGGGLVVVFLIGALIKQYLLRSKK